MSDSTLDQATFLPLALPKQSILDYSGSLSAADTTRLDQQVQALPGLKAKVVVLPKDFGGHDVDALGIALARRWHVGGERMLMVIDLKHQQVRLYPSKSLELRGLTPDVIRHEILAHQFIPFMRRGDLVGAIHNSLTAMSARVSSSKTVTAPGTTQQYQSTALAAPDAGGHQSSFGGLWLWVVGLAILGGGIYMFSRHWRKKGNADRI